MTFSLLARDPETGKLGGVSATGNLCVGGWVLAGSARTGITASQGQAPSTLWRDKVLTLMGSEMEAALAVAKTAAPDEGREYRQLTALDNIGRTGVFTGAGNGDFKGHFEGTACIASGNILTGQPVLEAMVRGYEHSSMRFEDRLLEALRAGEQAGGDERGVQSAAMHVVSTDVAPLTLRIDFHETPVSALGQLLNKTRDATYQRWLQTVPTVKAPHKYSAS